MHSPELTRLIQHTYKICLTQNMKYSSLLTAPCRCIIYNSLKLALLLAKHKYYLKCTRISTHALTRTWLLSVLQRTAATNLKVR